MSKWTAASDLDYDAEIQRGAPGPNGDPRALDDDAEVCVYCNAPIAEVSPFGGDDCRPYCSPRCALAAEAEGI